MQVKFFLFAGIAVLLALIFAAIGGYVFIRANNQIEQYDAEIEEWTTPNGTHPEKYLLWEISEGKDPKFVELKEDKKDAEDSKGIAVVMWIFTVIFILVAITMVVIHFVLEKRANDMMGASFFVEGEGPR